MCLALPVKIKAIRGKRVITEESGQKREIRDSLIRVKAGDYVILRNNLIINKVSKKAAREILSLINSKS